MRGLFRFRFEHDHSAVLEVVSESTGLDEEYVPQIRPRGCATVEVAGRYHRRAQPTDLQMNAKTPDELNQLLSAAFPPMPIDRATLDEATGRWDYYDNASELSSLEGLTWPEVEPAFLARHANLMNYAGDALFRATLPAYLRYLVVERPSNEVPFHVGGQLIRKDDLDGQRIFDRRTTSMTKEQRVAVREVLAFLATVVPMDEVMTRAHATWSEL